MEGGPGLRAAGFVAVLLGACLMSAGCDGTASVTTPPSTVSDTSSSIDGDPSWCVYPKVMEHHVEIAQVGDRLGDPRAGDSESVYLEVLSDAVWIPGPVVVAGGLDLDAIRESQRWIPDDGDGVTARLVAGDELEYRVLVPGYSGYVLEVVPLEAELCLVDDVVTSRFALAAADTVGTLESVTIEARVGASILAISEPITIEVAFETTPPILVGSVCQGSLPEFCLGGCESYLDVDPNCEQSWQRCSGWWCLWDGEYRRYFDDTGSLVAVWEPTAPFDCDGVEVDGIWYGPAQGLLVEPSDDPPRFCPPR